MFNATVSLLGDPDLDLRPNMSALVEIMIEDPVDRLVVPRSAVRLSGGKFGSVPLKVATHIRSDLPACILSDIRVAKTREFSCPDLG